MKKINLDTLLAVLGLITIVIGVVTGEDTLTIEGMILCCTAIIICYLKDIKSKLGE